MSGDGSQPLAVLTWGERDSGFLILLIGTLEASPHSIGASRSPISESARWCFDGTTCTGENVNSVHSKVYYPAQASPPALLLNRIYAAQADLELTL